MFSPDFHLKRIHNKIFHHDRLNIHDGIYILESKELFLLGWLADKVRDEKVGDYVSFVDNHHICLTNICKNSCFHCKFKRNEGDEDAFLLTIPEIREKAEEVKKLAVPEVLLITGIHPHIEFDYYLKALETIKDVNPNIFILAFSAVEIKHFAEIEKKSIKEIIGILKDAGLTAFTGGGVDFLDDSYITRLQCDENRLNSEEWISIHKTAHNLGIATNACMIYGVGETSFEVVENLSKIRELQDETQGFTHFFPYGFGNNGVKTTTSLYDLKMLILARLYLDNFKHIRAYWGYVGKQFAEASLFFGVDDLNGVKQKGRIIHTSGNIEPAFSSADEMIRIIRNAGKIPVERDILFNWVRTFT